MADWAAVATISTREDVQSFPVANLISIADGPVGNGTGIPYMYLTPLDYTAQDLAVSSDSMKLISIDYRTLHVRATYTLYIILYINYVVWCMRYIAHYII